MRTGLIDSMTCPYCGGGLKLKRALREYEGDVEYGLAECRCFVFPIVEGILLLSLSKGYGGAEEALMPYVPLQAAAVEHLEQGRVDALQDWMRHHLPLTRPFLDGNAGTYLEYSSRMAAQLDREVENYLDDFGRYQVLGNRMGPRRRLLRRALRRLKPMPSGRAHQLAQLTQFYAARFFSPYVHSTMMQLGWLPLSGRVLSLCCGHGMFENLLRADGRATDVVSMDGQFLNLLIVRQFVRPRGQFICHDLQFGLPFADDTFDAVFSSTCLPEIPAQRLFAREAIRVTRPAGWTWFDCIWHGEAGGSRIVRNRYYRFAQNFFGRLEDYVPFFSEVAGGRTVGIHVPTAPQDYADAAPHWATAPADVAATLARRKEIQISAIVGNIPDATERPHRAWLNPTVLGASPAFDAVRDGESVGLERRPGFETLAPTFAPKAFAGYARSVKVERPLAADASVLGRHYCAGELAIVPERFDQVPSTLRALLS